MGVRYYQATILAPIPKSHFRLDMQGTSIILYNEFLKDSKEEVATGTLVSFRNSRDRWNLRL